MCLSKETKLGLADETRSATDGAVKDLRKGGKFKRLFALNNGGKGSIIGTITVDPSMIAIPKIESAIVPCHNRVLTLLKFMHKDVQMSSYALQTE